MTANQKHISARGYLLEAFSVALWIMQVTTFDKEEEYMQLMEFKKS